MYATYTDGQTFEFQHCTALLKVAFSGLPEGATIKQIKVNTIGPKVDGKFNPSSPADFGGTSQIITISNPVTVDIYIYLPSIVAGQKVLHFEVTTSDDKVFEGTMKSTSNKPIEAGKLYTGTVELSLAIPYVAFEAVGAQTFKMSSGYEKLEYSLNNGATWTQLSSAKVPFGAGVKLLLRGKSSLGTNGGTISFGDKGIKVVCSGDIRTLVDYETHTSVNTASAIFSGLFRNCESLTTAPALPATTLAKKSYFEMFSYCTSLNNVTMLATDISATDCLNNCLY
jgi:hypothetical protein